MSTAPRWPALPLPAGLRWGLGSSVLLSAWVWLNPPETPSAAVVVAPVAPVAPRVVPASASAPPAQTADPWPAFDLADFDPFAGPRAEPARPAARASVAAVAPAPPPAPAPPVAGAALEARFAGRLVDPAGRQVIYLSLPDQTVVAEVGLSLPGGYVIASIEPTGVRVRPAADTTGRTVTIPFPRSEGDGR